MPENGNIPRVTSSDHKGAAVLATTLVMLGLRDVVISPGSRNAPLTIAFAGNPLVRTHVVIDERAAGYVALGLGLESGKPAAVICTSGSAAINHGPAIAEAFHQRTPLISITADRPTRFTGAGHGQTVSQQGLFNAHTVFNATIDENEISESEIASIASRAWTSANYGGPAHLNLPFEEPLYGMRLAEVKGEEMESLERSESDFTIPVILKERGTRTLFIGGPRNCRDKKERCSVDGIAGVFEKFSGITGDSIIESSELFPDNIEHTPTAVVTMGSPIMSKRLRKQISKLGVPHVHVGNDGEGWDMFGLLETTVETEPIEWTRRFIREIEQEEAFVEQFRDEKARLRRVHQELIKDVEWSDLLAFEIILRTVTDDRLHFANSTSVRYAMLYESGKHRVFHANRGVAGIDGCTSTAVGHALALCRIAENKDNPKSVTLITGDVAFLYDINGLASVQEVPSNLKIIVVNNGGGDIFKWLDGPEKTGLLDKFFTTKPKTSIKAAAHFCGVAYFCAEDLESTEKGIGDLGKIDGAAILEISTPPEISAITYTKYLRELRLTREHE